LTDSPSDHRLAGAIAKFNRSKEQFDELIVEMDAFFNQDPKPHHSVGEFDTEKWEWVERFQITQEPPLRLGVIFGDCIHNLRSALDHVIWQTTLLDGGTPDDSTQFPIASKSEAQFEAIAKRRIAGLSEKHRALVKQAQPYNAGDQAHRHPLGVLATLSNTDKHRVVHPAYSFISDDPGPALDALVGSYQGEDSSPVHAFWMAKRGTRLMHGTPWFRITWEPGEEPPREVQVNADMTLGIAFGDIGVAASSIRHIAEAVLKVIQAFMADFPETVWED
jgi:hypothetical protein